MLTTTLYETLGDGAPPFFLNKTANMRAAVGKTFPDRTHVVAAVCLTSYVCIFK
jgi:hypothetical protein